MNRKTIQLIIVLMLSAMTATATMAMARSPTHFSMTSSPTPMLSAWAMTTISREPLCTVFLALWCYIPRTSSTGDSAAILCRTSLVLATNSAWKTARRLTVRASGLHPSDITTASSISSRISTDMVCRCLYPTRLKDRGSIST